MVAYLLIGCVGLLLLLASLLLGDILDGLFDLDSPFLSTTAMSAFCAAFGFGGALALNAGTPGAVSIGIGLLAGACLGAVAGGVTRALTSGSEEVIPSMESVVGADGIVTAAIRPGALGEVSVRVGERVNSYSARAEDPIPVGAPITVTAALSPTQVSVRPQN